MSRWLVGVSLLLLAGCAGDRDQETEKKVLVRIGATTVRAEVADEPDEMGRGLGDREFLAPAQGMLFLWPLPTKPLFWMKGMKFPLDFIWINNGQVVDLHREIPPPKPGTPDSQLTRIQPRASVSAVLEVNAGFVDSHGIQRGDPVKIDY